MALYREYTDLHPDESCLGCPFNRPQTASCVYKSKKFYCYRDERFYDEMQAQPKLFD